MHAITLTKPDWDILVSLQRLFKIFVAPTTKLQANRYPTLNLPLPLYLKVIMRLTKIKAAVGRTSTLGVACSAALMKVKSTTTWPWTGTLATQ